MNNKKTKVTFCDLGAITKKLDALEINKDSGVEIQDMRIKLATIWLDHANKMQRSKKIDSKTYRYHAIEEDLILSAMTNFWNVRRYLQERSEIGT